MATNGIFKSWVPEWGIRIGIFLVFLPNLILLTISTANYTAAAGFYGIDPNDVSFSLIVQYATFVAYFVLEKRFSNYFVTKDYLFLSLSLEIILAFCSYFAKDFRILLFTRFLEGITSVNVASVCIALIISRLQSDRAVKISYSIVYVILLSIFPFITFITSPFLDEVDFNRIYFGVAFLFIPGAIFLLIIMKRGRLKPKVSLEGLDWQSALLFLLSLFSLCYILIYGQQLNWFDDRRIWYALGIAIVLGSVFIVRQHYSQNPYINISIFRNKHYLVGIVLVLVLYLARGAFNLTTNYFSDVLGMDPLHVGRMVVINILGIIGGSLVAPRMIRNNTFRVVWLAGFGCLLIYYFWMIFLFDTYADASTFFIPLFVQGFGAGLLLTPIVVFMVTSVPANAGLSAITIGICSRLMGTCISIAIINYFTLYNPENHFNRFQENLSRLNPNLNQNLEAYQNIYTARQITLDKAGTASLSQLNHHLLVQGELRSAMDYYYLMGWMLLLVLILIAIAPYIKREKRHIDPASDIPI